METKPLLNNLENELFVQYHYFIDYYLISLSKYTSALVCTCCISCPLSLLFLYIIVYLYFQHIYSIPMWVTLTKSNNIKLLLCGSPSVGKTSLLQVFLNSSALTQQTLINPIQLTTQEYKPTIGVNRFMRKIDVSNQVIKLELVISFLIRFNIVYSGTQQVTISSVRWCLRITRTWMVL